MPLDVFKRACGGDGLKDSRITSELQVKACFQIQTN
jgi:hypothetical protein